jgi:hypothetical protein
MKAFRSTAVVLALTCGLLGLPAQAQSIQQNTSGDPLYTVEAPKGYAMAGDLLIARPLLIAATVVGTGLFVVGLPFSALSGGVEESAQALVVEPGKAAFMRCLGCTRVGYDQPN